MMKFALNIFVFLFFANDAQLSAQWFIDSAVVKTVQINNVGWLNTKGNEFCPSIIADKLYFVSDYSPKNKATENFDILMATTDRQKISVPGINTPMHEGPFGSLQHTILFTRSSDTSNVMIRYDLNDQNEQVISQSNSDLQIFHPQPLGDDLMIAAVRPKGSEEKLDLKIIDLRTGLVVEPLENLNTAYNEAFPKLLGDDILSFASNRPGGKGGFDLYLSFFRDGKWTAPILLQAPFNSDADDFGLYMDASFKSGYFNSARKGGKGGDDIYSFKSLKGIIRKEIPAPIHDLTINLLDILQFKSVPGIKVRVSEVPVGYVKATVIGGDLQLINTEDDKSVDSLFGFLPDHLAYYTSDEEGLLRLKITENKQYLFKVETDAFQKQYLVYTAGKDAHQEFTIALSPKTRDDASEETRPILQGQKFIIEGLSFKEEEVILNAFAEDFMDDLANAMIKHPSMLIQLIAYTDARGNAVTNYKRSQKRAEMVKKYLTDKGVEALRVIALGEGETNIVNRCLDGVDCSPSEHEVNNRIEILGIED